MYKSTHVLSSLRITACSFLGLYVIAIAGCGGGSSGPGVQPSVASLPASVSRMVVAGTPVAVAVSITPTGFSFGSTFSATASDSAGVFAPAVSAVGDMNGYALTLSTSTSVAAGHYTGNVTVQLCADAACSTHQPVASIAVPFDVQVLSAISAWPGNNLTALAPWNGVAEWSMFQGNAAHTGYVPVNIDPNAFSTRWQIPAVDIVTSFDEDLNTLTTENGQLFISGNNLLFARKESDGSLVWQHDFSGLAFPSVNPPSVANGVVYVAAGQQSSTAMFAFKAADGTSVFQSPMSSQFEHYLAPAIGAQGVYTDAGAFGSVYGFDTSGNQLFEAALAQQSEWTPAVDSSAVYAYTGDALHVLDPLTGVITSSIPDPTFTNYIYAIGGSAVLGAPGSVFAASYLNSVLNGGTIGNTLLDFNVPGSSIAWSVPGDYPTTPAYNAGVLYVANNIPLRLEARSETDGTLLWSWTPPQPGDSNFVSETLLTKSMIFLSTNLATYGIDTTTHKTVWSYPLVGKLALSPNGILYIEGKTEFSPGLLTAINVH